MRTILTVSMLFLGGWTHQAVAAKPDAFVGKLVKILVMPGEKFWAPTMKFSHDGTKLVAMGDYFAVYDLATEQEILRVLGIANEMTYADFSPDGTKLGCTYRTRDMMQDTVRVYDLQTKKPQILIEEAEDRIRGVCFSPDGKLLAAALTNSIQVFDLASGKRTHKLDNARDRPTRLLFSRDGKYVLSGSHQGGVKVWDLAQAKLAGTIEANGYTCLHACAGQDTLIVPDDFQSGTISRWNLSNLKELDDRLWAPPIDPNGMPAPPGNIGIGGMVARNFRTRNFTADGRLAVGVQFEREDKTKNLISAAVVRDTITGAVCWKLPTIEIKSSLAISPDGKQVAHMNYGTRGTIQFYAIDLVPEAKGITEREIAGLADDLLATDGAKSYEAMLRLAKVGDAAARIGRERLFLGIVDADPKVVDGIVADLDKADFKSREAAVQELITLGIPVLKRVREVLAAEGHGIEKRRALERVVEALNHDEDSRTLHCRWIFVLERIGSDKAQEVLKKLASESSCPLSKREAQAAIHRLMEKDPKVKEGKGESYGEKKATTGSGDQAKSENAVEKAKAKAAPTAKQVHLVFKDTPLSQAAAEFSRQSGYALRIVSRGNINERKVTLDTGKTTFWEAFEAFCKAADLRDSMILAPKEGEDEPAKVADDKEARKLDEERDTKASQLLPMLLEQSWDFDKPEAIVLTDGKTTLPACNKGVGRIQALPAHVRLPYPAYLDESVVNLSVRLEPCFWVGPVVKIEVTKAVDDQGRDVTCGEVPLHRNVHPDSAILAGDPRPRWDGIPVRIRHADKAGQAPKIMRHLKGVITIEIKDQEKDPARTIEVPFELIDVPVSKG